MLWLSEEARLGIVSGAIAILILMVICMICKLSRLHKRPAYKDSNYSNDDTPDGGKPVSWQRRASVGTECSECVRERSHVHAFDKYASGSLKFAMVYQTSLQNLFLSIIEAEQITGKDFWDALDSYVKVRLLPDEEGTLRGQTEVCKKSFNPKFQETFQFTVTLEQLPKLTLHLSVWEMDKYSRSHMIGQVTLELGHVLRPDEPVALAKRLILPQRVGVRIVLLKDCTTLSTY